MSLGETLVKTGHLSEQKLQEIEKQAEDLVSRLSPAELEEALEKVGFPGDKLFEGISGDLASKARQALVVGGLGLGTDLAVQGGRALYALIHKKHSFSKMLEANPQLAELPDQQKIQRNFETMYRFNPAYASDPHVAGSVVKIMYDQELLDPSIVKGLIDTNSSLQKGNPHSAMDFFAGLKGEPGPDPYKADQAQRQAAEHEMKTREHGWKQEDREYQAAKVKNEGLGALDAMNARVKP
jgi:hypothetical protein